MKAYTRIDYSFAPASYWEEDDLLQTVLRNVKGENRRQMIIDYLKAGQLDELDEVLLADELGKDDRDRLARIHPSFMGGEYLPGYLPGEVEIARICLQSTTSDVISVRARPSARSTIAYRVVDEYEEEFVLPFKESSEPLTLKELIQLLDDGTMQNSGFAAGGLSLGYNNLNAEEPGDRQRLRNFTSISSSLYRDLHQHYEHVFDEWVSEVDVDSDSPE